MPEEKKENKPGMVNALSRILHLHQLPNQPTEKWPSNAEPVIPIHAQNKPTVNASSNASATINPPFVSPARTTPSATIPPRPTPMTPVAASPISPARATPLAPTPNIARPSIAPTPVSPIKPAAAKPAATSAVKSSPWPFQAPWNAGKNKGMGPLPASASSAYPAAATPASASPTPAKPAPLVRAPAPAAAAAPKSPAVSSLKPASPISSPSPAPISSTPSTPMNMQSSISSAGNRIAGADSIVTNYDRILDLVRLNQNMKLDDLTRAMQMDEERVAEELQTLEDNGLIEIRYPAFGEPIVHYKG